MSDDSLDFDQENAATLAELLADPMTSEAVRLQIIGSLLDEGKEDSFFESMFRSRMTLSKCPFCSHSNHWLIPSDDLAQMSWVTYKEDSRVKPNTTEEDCPVFQESCQKKKVHV